MLLFRKDLNHPPTAVFGIHEVTYRSCRKDLKHPPTDVGGIRLFAQSFARIGQPHRRATQLCQSHKRSVYRTRAPKDSPGSGGAEHERFSIFIAGNIALLRSAKWESELCL